MKHLVVIFSFVFLAAQSGLAQKYFTKTGYVSFFSDTNMEKIEGHNKSSSCVLDAASGNIEFAVLIKGFQFEKALMQEHFNENYLESSKFPKAIFKGKITNISAVDFTKNGKTNVKVSGQMTMHGVTKDVVTDAVISIVKGKIEASSEFSVLLADYGVVIPALVKDQIAKSVKIKVLANLEEFKK